jgi:hypothetical protein|tara:strand:+ start:3321 stop:3569 length:249 start_codon:yes stop_codon:yes gene_type:complete
MTVETCLRLAKELGDKGDSQNSLFYLERARSKVAKHPKYQGMKIEGFKLLKNVAVKAPPESARVIKNTKKPKEKKDGKKSKG